MQAIRFQTRVDSTGHLPSLEVRLQEGTEVEVIILVREQREEFSDLVKASETTLDFWDNPIDDEVWNDA